MCECDDSIVINWVKDWIRWLDLGIEMDGYWFSAGYWIRISDAENCCRLLLQLRLLTGRPLKESVRGGIKRHHAPYTAAQCTLCCCVMLGTEAAAHCRVRTIRSVHSSSYKTVVCISSKFMILWTLHIFVMPYSAKAVVKGSLDLMSNKWTKPSVQKSLKYLF